jgi:hypothetical protein
MGVTCTGLTPGATYNWVLGYHADGGTSYGTLGTADPSGTLAMEVQWGMMSAWPRLLEVCRVETTGNVRVLSGPVVWK